MSILHGIFSELGIEPPVMHPEREPGHAPEWVIDARFHPVQGKSYELAFGKIIFAGKRQPVIRRVRIDGLTPDTWIDLDTHLPLDRDLQLSPVRGFRELPY